MSMSMAQHATHFGRGILIALCSVLWLLAFHPDVLENDFAAAIVFNATIIVAVFEAVRRPSLWQSLIAVVFFSEAGLLVTHLIA